MFALALFKSFRPHFSKGGEVKGEKPLSLSAESETPYAFEQRRKGEFSSLCEEKRGTLAGGSPCFYIN